jgi:hypothetical protein
MKLYHPEHGTWEGEPIDAKVLLERGWQEKLSSVVEEVEEPKPVKRGRKKA